MKFKRSVDAITKNNFFAHIKPLSFAHMGGRYLIVNENQELFDFGDGNIHERRGIRLEARFKHDKLGEIKGLGSVLTFYKYKISFDFADLSNCYKLDLKKMKNKPDDWQWYDTIITYNLKKFNKKHNETI